MPNGNSTNGGWKVVRWLLDAAAVLLLAVSGYAATALVEHTADISALKAANAQRDVRLDGFDDRLDRIEAKIDRLLERHTDGT